MKKSDWFIKQLKCYGFNAEISAFGGYHVEIDWDYTGYENWLHFSSPEAVMAYLTINGLI